MALRAYQAMANNRTALNPSDFSNNQKPLCGVHLMSSNQKYLIFSTALPRRMIQRIEILTGHAQISPTIQYYRPLLEGIVDNKVSVEAVAVLCHAYADMDREEEHGVLYNYVIPAKTKHLRSVSVFVRTYCLAVRKIRQNEVEPVFVCEGLSLVLSIF